MVGVDRDVLATPGALKLLVYQALLPVNCPHCKVRGDELLASDDRMEPYIARLNRLYRMTPEQLYFRNPDGCPQCRREGLPELNGFKGRTVVAEMCEPDDQMLEFLKDSQNLELQRYVSTLKRGDYMDSNMDYKSTLENAIYKMGTGLIDPREIEPRFSSFETIEIRRRNAEELDARKALLAAANNQRRARENRPPPPGMPDFVSTSPGSL